jgi:WD40 repeat protein
MTNAKLNVFISYSRDDLRFADQLDAALGLTGFATEMDRHGISGGEAWKQRLGSLIRDADTVVFVLSPSSAASEICAWEVEEAARLGKRIIPVLCQSLDGASPPPPRLAGLNYIFFYDEPKSPGSGFGLGLTRLVTALNTDLDWLREHTRLLQRASEWESGGRVENRLLSGADVVAAKTWLSRRPNDAPEPTLLHLDFIRASEEAEVQRLSAERQHLEHIAAAQAAREAALAEKEVAQLREAEASKRVVRRTLAGLTAAIVLALIASGFGLLAWSKQQEAALQAREASAQAKLALEAQADAEKASKEAETARQQAIETRDAALLNQSQYFTELAKQEIERGNGAAGLMLALEALPDPESDNEVSRIRPHWPSAVVALEAGHRALRERRVLSGHVGSIFGVAVTSDGAKVVTTSADHTVRIWDAHTGVQLRVLRGHGAWVRGVALSPDGARIVTGSGDETARIWDARTGEQVAVLTGHEDAVSGAVFSPDGARIVTGSADGTARVWDARTGAELTILKGHRGGIWTVAVTANGTRIVTASDDETARIWDARTGKELRVLKGHTANVLGATVTADGSRVVTASGDHTVRIWDIVTGAELMVLKGHNSGVSAVTATRDGGRVVSVSDDKTVRIWDAKTGAALAVLIGHNDSVQTVAMTPDGTQIVSGSVDGTARIWDARTTSELMALRGHTSSVYGVAITSDGARIVTTSEDRTARVWDARTGTQLSVFRGHSRIVWNVAVAPDGSRAVSAGDERTVRIWDTRTGSQVAVLNGHIGWVRSVAFAPDGSQIITGSDDGTIRIWNAADGAELRVLTGHTDWVRGLAVMPDGTRLVSTSKDKTARIWDMTSGAELAVLRGHNDMLNGVAVTPDGTRVVTTSNDQTARIWDARTGAELLILKGHESWVYSVAVSSDGSRIVTGSGDHTARVWDSHTGEELAVLKGHGNWVYGAAITPDGKRIVTASADRTARVWEFFPSGQELIARTKTQTPRCLSQLDRKRFHLAPVAPRWCGMMNKWPYDAASLVVEAEEHLEGKHYPMAIAAFTAALDRDSRIRDIIAPRLAIALNSNAWSLFLAGSLAEGLADANRAAALVPDDVDILDTRGQIYLALDRVDAAFADLDRAIANGVSEPGTYFGRGRCYEARGDTLAAVADYRKTLELKAEDEYDKSVQDKARERLAAMTAHTDVK